MVGSGANVYGGVDWVAMGMAAQEDADLLDPQVRLPASHQARLA